MEGYGGPDRIGVFFGDALALEEVARGMGAVDLEALVLARMAGHQADVMERRASIEQLAVELQATLDAGERPEMVDPTRMVEEKFCQGDGAELLENARSLGLEGIIAKHRDSPYRSGRTGDWPKIKCIQSESFMIVGYEQSAAARGGIGSLLLAARRDHDWVYVGEVGTGFKEKDAAYLKKTLDTLKTKTPVVPLKGKNYVFAQPTLIAEIEFRGWTDDGNLRHASYKGLREIQDNASVYELSP